MGHGHRVDFVERHAGLLQGPVDRRQNAFEMGPGCDLRHDAAEPAMQFVLRRDDRTEHFEPIVNNRRRRLVAGGFQSEDVHGVVWLLFLCQFVRDMIQRLLQLAIDEQ